MASAAIGARDQHYKVILLGKTGSGISASRNTILGQKSFISRKTFKSVTQDVQKETAIFPEVTLDVYDTPGLFKTAKSNEDILVKWKSELNLDETTCTVILMVMKVDKFTPEDKEAVRLIEDFIPEDLIQNTWILFTRGDELMRAELTIEEFFEDTEELQKLVQRFQNRYHVFDNISQNPDQVQKLIHKIRKSARIISSETPNPEYLPHRRIVLLGKTGVGKSATGNTILRKTRFKSELSSSSKCEIQSEIVSGRNVSVIDTPGLFDTKLSQEELSVEIWRSIYLSSPGPHAFLYVQPVNIRYTEQEEDVIQKLEKIFGGEMKKYTIILFTYGDQLEGKSVDELIQENISLRRIFDECGGRYHIFNNKQQNREQVSELLQKIDSMVEENEGTYYSNEMYEEAARFRREEEEARIKIQKEAEIIRREEEEKRREEAARIRTEEEEKRGEEAARIRREEEEKRGEEAARIRREEEEKRREEGANIKREGGFTKFYKRNKGKLLTAAGIGGGSGAAIGAIVGVVVGGLIGADIGAGIGAGISAVLGAGAGFGVGTALRKKTEQSNQRNQNTQRERAYDSDGERESPDCNSMSDDEETPLF